MRTHQLHRAGSPRQHKIRMMMRINRALCFIAGPQEAKTPAVFAM